MSYSCSICLDVLVPAHDEIVIGGKCGHCFHSSCLNKWMATKKLICPQCRAPVSSRTVVRIFMNKSNDDDTSQDPGRLIQKVDSLAFHMHEKEAEIKKLNGELQKVGAEMLRLCDEAAKKDKAAKVQDTKVNVLTEEVRMFRRAARNAKHLEDENKTLRDRLEHLKAIGDLVDATAKEADELVQNERDHRVLATMLVNLKRELKASSVKLNSMREKISVMAADLRKEKQKRIDAEETLVKLRGDLHYQEILVGEYETQLKALKAADPLKQKVNHTISVGTPESVNKIVNSQSPYFSVQSSSVGLSALQPRSSNIVAAPLRPLNSGRVAPLKPKTSEKRPAESALAVPEFGILAKRPKMETKPGTNQQFNGMGGSVRAENYDPIVVIAGVGSLKKYSKKTTRTAFEVNATICLDY